MTDNEIKEDCLQQAGIDLGRYGYKELTEIKDALRRYHNAKLKLLGIGDVVNRRELLLDFADYSEIDKTSQTTDECVDNYLDSIK